jgi:hypothetical protein
MRSQPRARSNTPALTRLSHRQSASNSGLENSEEINTLAMLNIEPPEPKNSGSNADDPINLAHLLGMLHIVDLIC